MRIQTVLAICGLCFLGAVVGTARTARAQTELDRIVARVNNRIITQSDVRQARLLRLVDDTSSDEAARRCLEERVLALSEIARASPLPPTTDGDLVDRRAGWEGRVGGPGRAADLLREAGMSEKALQLWLRDDLRIDAHLRRQFGSIPESDRSRAAAEWMSRLRQRAGLK